MAPVLLPRLADVLSKCETIVQYSICYAYICICCESTCMYIQFSFRAITGLVIALLSTLVLMATGKQLHSHYTEHPVDDTVLMTSFLGGAPCLPPPPPLSLSLSLSPPAGYASQLDFFLNTEPDIIFRKSLTHSLQTERRTGKETQNVIFTFFLSLSLSLLLPPSLSLPPLSLYISLVQCSSSSTVPAWFLWPSLPVSS